MVTSQICGDEIIIHLEAMNVLFDLPDVQQGLILSQWIEIEGVARFDSAVCSTRYRSDFLDLIKSPQCVFPSFTCNHDAAADKWVVSRQMSFHAILWQGTNDPILRESVLKLSSKTIRRLDVKSASALMEDQNGERIATALSKFDSDDRLSEALGFVARHVSQLTELAIFGGEGCTLGTRECLVDLIRANPSLSALGLDDTAGLSHEVMKAICAAPSLTQVQLSCVTFESPPSGLPADVVSSSVTSLAFYDLPETSFQDICSRFPNLAVLSGCMDDVSELAQLSSITPLLSDVKLCFNGSFQDSMALSTAKNWRLLTRLALQSLGDGDVLGEVCSEQSMLQFIEHCPLLQYLNLCEHECDMVRRPGEDEDEPDCDYTDPGLAALRGDMSGPGSHLQVLRVDSLTAAGLHTVITQCKHLHTLSICDMQSVVPAKSVLQHLAGSTVRTLHLQNCFRLCDADLLPLCDLEALYLSYDGKLVTDAALVGVASRCPALHTLMVYGEANVTRACVLPILQHCPVLRSLELYTNDGEEGEQSDVDVFKQQVKEHYPLLNVLEVVVL